MDVNFSEDFQLLRFLRREMTEVTIAIREDKVLVGQELIEQLRDVFDACDTEGHGLISLNELGNISRSHVGRGQVDQILEILGPGGDEDKIDFEQFYQKFVEFMKQGVNINEEEEDTTQQVVEEEGLTKTSNHKADGGVFNENLKRAIEKNVPYKTSPNKQAAQRNLRRKSSQARLCGRIPLVNTSSEDEAEDSFDRKIASSLALARPMDIQPQFLVRGSTTRSTVRKNSNPSSQQSPNMSTSTRKFSTTSRTSPTSTVRMSPILAPSCGSSFTSPMSSCSTPSPRSGHNSPEKEAGARLALSELERKVEQLAEMADRQGEESDSPSSGVGSLRADLEEEINSSIFLARKHGEERLDAERLRHSEQMRAVERERDLERRNFQLRFEQFQEEQERLKREVEDMKGKLNLVNVEKEHLEEQVTSLVNKQNCLEVHAAAKDTKEEQKRKDKEEELLTTVQKLTVRVQSQDEDLAEAKEDNIVLRSQVKRLKEKECKDGGKFKMFGGGKEAPAGDDQCQDPNDIRVKLRTSEQELNEQKEVNVKLKQYLGEVLGNIMVKNPQMLEKTNQI